MTAKRRLLALAASLALLLSACGPQESAASEDSALTWTVWAGYDRFWDLLAENEPDIEIEYVSYAGANYTGYSWAQMRADDITDLFSTTQILDEELVKERLLDLSDFDFINGMSTALLDQVAIDGGVYLLPVNNTMYGIFYNKTLMEEKGWELPTNFAELEALCAEIRAEGLIPGVIGTQLTGAPFSAVMNLAKTDWLTTPAGVKWEQDFLNGDATAAGMWEGTMDYVQKYIDIGMLTTDPEDLPNLEVLEKYLGGRQSVFFTSAITVSSTQLSNGDELGMMPYIGEDGSKNVYMYNPSTYFGISKRLAEPGNEDKLEKAIRLLTLLYSEEGQSAFASSAAPCVMGVLNSSVVPEDSLIYDARQAMQEGRAFPMTYAHWENVLADMGQAFKEWFRGENGMDGSRCIARMDALQSDYLNHQEMVYFCESTADFTLEETAQLVGKALGSAVGADAALVPYGSAYIIPPGVTYAEAMGMRLQSGVTGKLYAGKINAEVVTTIASGNDGDYVLMTMTGAQAKELAAAGFDRTGTGQPFPYAMVVRGGAELEDDAVYKIAFITGSYDEAVAQAYHAQMEKGSLRAFLRTWLEEQGAVSPDGNPWE